MSGVTFEDKFIAYIDVLGFSKLVEAAVAGSQGPLDEVLQILTEFGSPKHRERFARYGPTLCPESKCLQRHLDFQVTSISDCLIVSSEVSPAGVINLLHHCWAVVLCLLQKGFMCRGYITRGLLYHTDAPQVIGPPYQKAYEYEKNGVTAFNRQADERGTPFVEVDKIVGEYVEVCANTCVKEMYSRFVKGDGSTEALFPFQRLAHSFIVGDYLGHKFDADEERQSNQNIRLMLRNMKERVKALVDISNPSAVSKSEHYIHALDTQLNVCNQTDETLTQLSMAFPKTP